MIAAALLAAAALILPSSRWRARALLAAPVVAAVVLAVHVWDAEQVRDLRDDPALGVVLLAAAAAAVGGLAALLARRPALLPALALAAVPWRVPVEVDGRVVPLVAGMWVVAAAAVLAYARPRLGEERDERAPGPLEWVVAAVVAAYAVQALGGHDGGRALEDVTAFHVPGAVLLAVLARTPWTARTAAHALAALAAVAVALAGLAVVERLAGAVLVSPGVVAAHRADSSMRIGSLFFDPDLFGRFLAVAAVGLGAVLTWARRGRDLALAAGAAAVVWAGLVTTLSRPAFAALLGGLALLAVLRRPRPAIVVAAVAALAVGAAGAVLTADGAVDRRADIVQAAVERSGDHLLTGRGSGAAGAGARIEPLAVAEEQGLAGLVLLLALLAAAAATLLRGGRGDPVRAALAAAFAAVVVHAWGAGRVPRGPVAVDPARRRHRAGATGRGAQAARPAARSRS